MRHLFNSYTKPIPPVRYDIQRIPINENGNSLLYFHDSMGYATPDLALPIESETMLSLIDGARSVEDILKFGTGDVNKEQILSYVRFLDEHRLLQSEYFTNRAELTETKYEESTSHHTTTAGASYPSDPDELKEFLDHAFEEYEQSNPVSSANGMYAPHIDPRVGISSYVKAFSSIKKLKPKKVVVLATSHYSGVYGKMYEDSPFIISNKTFVMPNGEIASHKPTLDVILNSFQDLSLAGISNQARAHRIEHSIELHLLFLNYIWDHEFEIAPILVGNLDELMYSDNSFREQQLDSFSTILRALKDEETFFLISGDLSHFGHKFGDQKEASMMFEDVKSNDKRFLETGASGNPDKLISLMKEEYDLYRICGFSPLLTFLKAFPESRGSILSYDLWDEKDQKSAVSFGSILYT
ncbi:MAG: AmmeMemoRadiSam system protein B [Balneolaceae bacterium]|nr:AmmeMemoRadiSam system protein B [Balneolaceae bacterium]MBO6545078.1 AmmeMemoRadiSam system protein B [Balneolaceae bacterium]MBO6646474.1 AmmeMemoRadiSam system protein B [Balneolaceae bacterium]